jgi:hypothetical protein
VANPRVGAVCNRCGFERLHYTRKDGSIVRPCMMCSRQRAAELKAAHEEDESWREKRRKTWRKYNQSEKGKARSGAARRRMRSADDDPAG